MHSKILSALFRICVSTIFLYFIFLKVDLQGVFLNIQKINILYIIVALSLIIIGICIAALRWFYIINEWNGDTFSFKRALDIFFISFFYSIFLPGGQAIGEIVKGYRISRNAPNQASALYSVIVDRLIGFIALFPLLAVAFFSLPDLQVDNTSLYVFLISFIIAFLSVIILASLRLAQNIIHLIFQIISFFRRNNVVVSNDIKPLNKHIAIVLGLGVLNHLAMGIAVFVLARGIGIIGAPFVMILWIYLISGILSFFPISYAGLGPREWIFVYFLGMKGITPEKAIAISLLFIGLNMIVAIVGLCLELNNVLRKQPFIV